MLLHMITSTYISPSSADVLMELILQINKAFVGLGVEINTSENSTYHKRPDVTGFSFDCHDLPFTDSSDTPVHLCMRVNMGRI